MRVVELAHVAAGPFAGMLLADLGADDLARVRGLVAAADVVVENYRPGVLDRLGLGYPTVSEGHRGLVYCSISGYGLSSPYVDAGAYDVVIQGMSGLMSVTGEPDGNPVKAGVPVGDFTAGLYAAYTIAALLPGVRDTGTSVRVDCPMLDCLLGVSALQTSEYWGSGHEPQRLGTAHPRNAPYQGFSAADGDLTVAAGNDRLWAAVADVVGLPHLVADPRFLTQLDRVAHRHELEALLQERFAVRKREEWLTELRDRGVPCGPVNTFGEMLADPHVEATGLVASLDVPLAGPTPTVVFPVRIEGQRPRLDRTAPRLGADADVYDEWVAR